MNYKSRCFKDRYKFSNIFLKNTCMLSRENEEEELFEKNVARNIPEQLHEY